MFKLKKSLVDILPYMYDNKCICSDCWQEVFHILFPFCLSAQHEKYTSQLQLGIKSLEAKIKEKQQLQSLEKGKDGVSNVKLQDRTERRAQSLTGKQFSPHTRQQSRYMLAGMQRVYDSRSRRNKFFCLRGTVLTEEHLNTLFTYEEEEVCESPCAA